MQTKIFCIGFHKTGTTSLARALNHIGYRVRPIEAEDFGNPPETEQSLAALFSMVDEFDAFRDNPWPVLYRELDARFPGSKFILTLRPTRGWIRSVLKHFGTKPNRMREWIYGVGYPEGNESTYTARFEQHNRDVVEYFKDRPGDLLQMKIIEGEGWEQLCSFFDRPVPDKPFPHANRAKRRQKRQQTAPDDA